MRSQVGDLSREFRGNLKGFRPVPFWFWNGDPTTRAKVCAQILELKARGVDGVMPMPLYGLNLEYGRAPWYAMIKYAAEVCARAGIKLWLYDEFHCPSGTCAGRVLQEHPEYRNTMLVFHSYPVRQGRTLSLYLRPSWERFPDPSDAGEIFADTPPQVYAEAGKKCAPVHDFTLGTVAYDARARRTGNGHLFRWRNRTGADVVLHLATLVASHAEMPSAFGTKWATHQPGYLDVLNPAAVRAFLDMNFAGYDREVKKYYGKVIPGMFTDEPGMGYGVYGGFSIRFPYTAALFGQFADTYGYDLRPRIVELITDTGDFRRTRNDYWGLVTRLFSENYNRQYAEACARRGLVYTGHYMAEETLNGCASMNGDMHMASRWMQMPGLDLLRTDTPYDAGQPLPDFPPSMSPRVFQMVTAKALVSTAHAAGAKRILCEANGIPKWSVTLRDLKKMADWLGGMGVNFMNDNGVPYSLQGPRIMAGRSLTSPWWPHYKAYADYVARLSLMMTAGQAAVDTAVLYPSTAVWTQLNRFSMISRRSWREVAADAPAFFGMQRALLTVTERLLRTHREYDYLYESALSETRVVNGRIAAGGYRYRTVILPAVSCLDEAGFAQLQEFLRQGGNLLAIGRFPDMVLGARGVRRLPQSAWRHPRAFRLRDVPADPMLKRLTSLLERLAPNPVRVAGEEPEMIQCTQRIYADARMAFLVNHAERAQAVKLDWAFAGAGEVWKLESGRIEACASDTQTDAGTSFSFSLAPHESRMIVMRSIPSRSRKLVAAVVAHESRRIELSGPWRFTPDADNAFLLSPQVAFDFNDRGLAQNWMNGAGGCWEPVRDGQARLALAPELMAAYWLRAEVDVAALPRRLRLFHDGEAVCRVFLNGHEARRIPSAGLWDPDNLCFDLRPLLRAGKNVAVLRVTPSQYVSRELIRNYTYLMKSNYPFPAVLAGDFVVLDRGVLSRWRLPCQMHPDSWHTQGFPFYAGVGRYAHDFRWDGQPDRTWLELGALRDVATVTINGSVAGCRPWPPYTLEIRPWLKRGRNRLEIAVANTFGNLLHRHYTGWDDAPPQAAGLSGPVRLRQECAGAARR